MRRRKPEVLAFVMAGGEGTRLYPLTEHRCKPSVSFNGKHRVVDFALSNLVNSEIFAIYVLVQYKSQALIEHLRNSWTMAPFIAQHFITVVPPQMHHGREWFQGTADAVAQNLHLIETLRPDLVAVFGADHIYRMDVNQMVDEHLARQADASVATLPVPLARCAEFGIVETDDEMWIRDFREKPRETRAMPGRATHALASMGNYVFAADLLMRELRRAQSTGESDFGRHVLPRLARSCRMLAYDFGNNRVPGVADFEEPGYWRDVGTIEAYFDAHFDTLGARPKFRLTNPDWPIYTQPDPAESTQIQGGSITSSALGSGCVVRDAQLDHALLQRMVTVEEDARLEHCIVMERCVVGRGAKIARAIVDQDNHIPAGEVIGGSPERDRMRFHVSETGIVVVPRGHFSAATAG